MSPSRISHLWAWLAVATALITGAVLAAQVQPLRPTDPGLTTFAYDEIKAGKYQDAVKHLRARIKADPSDGNAVFLLAVARSRLGQFKVAAHDFEVYRRHGGKNPELAYEYGVALLGGHGDSAVATKELEAYRQAHPQSGKASIAVGRAYFATGRIEPAEAAFKAAGGDTATRPSSLMWLAMVEQTRKNDAAARGYLDELLKTSPNSAEVALLKRAGEAAKKP